VPSRLVAPIVAAVLAAGLLAGCGDSASEETSAAPKAPAGARAQSCDAHATGAESLRATGVPCGQARRVLHSWQRQRSCSLPGGASRGSCLARSYRCQAARTDRGLAVSCARPGQSIAFVARR
jgi:hypothetical protein